MGTSVKSAQGIFLASILLLLPAAVLAQSPNTIVEDGIAILDTALTERREEITSDKEAKSKLLFEAY